MEELKYDHILSDRQKFIQAGTRNGSEFNYFDTTTTKYFKIMFYFNNIDSDNMSEAPGGLLAPSWLKGVNINSNEINLWKHNSAWSYLVMNGETTRADYLQQFITLLSNINTESPWYFSELSGVGEALNRTQINDNGFVFQEERKKLTIKCLPDSYDDRISTLLDLYRAIVWSWQTKRSVLPANLRKFDMGVYIYSDPIQNVHKKKISNGFFSDLLEGIPLVGTEAEYEYATIDFNDTENYKTSFKYIEFHNCEIDYNSGTSVLDGLNNKEGLYPTYDINIYYDDCYENRYNEFLARKIGDFVWVDTHDEDKDLISEDDRIALLNKMNERNGLNKGSALDNALDQLKGVAIGAVDSFVERVTLGNLYGLSISRLTDQYNSMMNGDVFSTIHSVGQYIRNNKPARSRTVSNLGDIYPDAEKDTTSISVKNIHPAEPKGFSKPKAFNIFSANSKLNYFNPNTISSNL